MTKKEYEAYQGRVAEFFEREGLDNLSNYPTQCDDCSVELDSDGCPECGKDTGEVNNEPHFSHYPCECCRRHLGGDRHTCYGYNPTTKEVCGPYSVCQDCVYYAEYGRLDDQTMQEMGE